MTALLRLAARLADHLLGRPYVDLEQRLAAYTYSPGPRLLPPSRRGPGDTSPHRPKDVA